MPSYSELIIYLRTAPLPHTKGRVTQLSEAKSTSVLGESWELPQNELIILHCLWELPQRRCSQRSKGTLSCCCPARLVTYWARNAPTKLGQRETVLHLRSSGGRCYCKLVPSTTKWYISNTHAAFHNLYIGKGGWWFSQAIFLLPLTYLEVQKILFGYHDNTPPKELNPATSSQFTCYFLPTTQVRTAFGKDDFRKVTCTLKIILQISYTPCIFHFGLHWKTL